MPVVLSTTYNQHYITLSVIYIKWATNYRLVLLNMQSPAQTQIMFNCRVMHQSATAEVSITVTELSQTCTTDDWSHTYTHVRNDSPPPTEHTMVVTSSNRIAYTHVHHHARTNTVSVDCNTVQNIATSVQFSYRWNGSCRQDIHTTHTYIIEYFSSCIS